MVNKFYNIIEADVARAINIIKENFKSIDTGKPVREYIDTLINTGVIDERILETLAGKIEMVVPYSSPGSDYKEGTSQVIISANKAVVVDLGWSHAQAVINTCLDKGVNHIAALCITHMHDDHCTPTAVQALVNAGLLDNTSRIYWSVPDWSLFDGLDYASVYREIEQIAVNNGIEITVLNTEGQEIDTGITGLYCNAFNCSQDVYRSVYGSRLDEDHAVQSNDDLNYFSVCYRFQFGNKSFICCGDIMPTNQAYLYPIFTNCDFYSVPHHGLNIWNNREFAINTPKLCYIGCYRDNTSSVFKHGYPDTTGKRMYSNQYTDIVFTITHFTISVNGQLVDTTGNCGNYIEPGTDIFTLPWGRYYSPNESVTGTLVHAPAFTSGFILDIVPGAREDKHLTATSLYNWHSTKADCNTSVGTWAYTVTERTNPN